MAKFRKTILGTAAALLCTLAPLPAFAEAYEGIFVGSMVCETGAVGVLLRITEDGPITREEFDHSQGICRSGAGKCNDLFDLKYQSTRKVKGSLDVFPIAANPSFQAAKYQITGLGTSYESLTSAASAVAQPNSAHTYLNIKSTATSDLFQSTVSELAFKINIGTPYTFFPNSTIFAQVHGPHCAHLTLTQIKETTP